MKDIKFFVFINSVIEVDVVEQICADYWSIYEFCSRRFKWVLYEDFLSEGEKAIIALSFITKFGVSRIVFALKPEAVF